MADLHVAFSYTFDGVKRTVPEDGRCSLCWNGNTPDLRYFGDALFCKHPGTCYVGGGTYVTGNGYAGILPR